LYKNFTGGSEWLTTYPPLVPKHRIWRADHFGQEHFVVTQETHFEQELPSSMSNNNNLSIEQMRQGREDETEPYRAPGTMNLTIKALSCAPRIFEIRNFLTEMEVDHILNVVKQETLSRSKTGLRNGQVSEIRTSSTTWLPRHTDPILNAVFRPVADALRIDESLLRTRETGEENSEVPNTVRINDDLQILHYNKGEQYTAHHNFFFPKTVDHKKGRSINLCMYLNDTPRGGETSRWGTAETNHAINVKPEKGKAVIFYMVNPDGNLDDLSQHAALPVMEGETYSANLWILTC
jgi:prolyl 4-hydroxylase